MKEAVTAPLELIAVTTHPLNSRMSFEKVGVLELL